MQLIENHDSDGKRSRLLLFFLLACLLLPLAYALYTGHIWEDFFITFRHSENLAAGKGLSYRAEERIHGFTSPLGTILPAFCHLVSGNTSYLHAIWLYRLLFCVPAFAAAGWILLNICQSKLARLNRAHLLIFVILLYLLDIKAIMFSVNGMETAFMLMFIACTLYVLEKNPPKSALLLGFSWGGLMWTRPDSCVHVVAIAAGYLLFSPMPRKNLLALFLRAALVATAVYLPWFVFAWSYYGSPVPHTVIAKNAAKIPISTSEWLNSGLYWFPRKVSWIFGPVYPYFRSWPPIIKGFASFLGFFCALYFLSPGGSRFARRLSAAFFVLMMYFTFMPFPYPWYFPPASFIGIPVIVLGFADFANAFRHKDRFKYLYFAYSIALVILSLQFGLTVFQMRLQQSLVENGVRRKVGLWLKENCGKEEKIYLEPLGYIGYFSGGNVCDFPGLATPEVVRLQKEKSPGQFAMITELEPEWLVMRPVEHLVATKKGLLADYSIVKKFSAINEINKYPYIPGEFYLLYDAEFFILESRRGDSPSF